MSRQYGTALLMAVAIVAMTSLFLFAKQQTGMMVSVVPSGRAPLVVVSPSTALQCLSNAYCAPDEVCVQGTCVNPRWQSAGIMYRAQTPDPVPNYGSYERGGEPRREAPSLENDAPSYEYSDFYRHEPLTKY